MSSTQSVTGKGLPRGPHKLTRGEVVANQRQRMLDAVPYACMDRGYVNLTAEDIAARAGVSKRSFYENFRDVDQCFLTSYRAHVEVVVMAVGGAVAAAPDDWRERTRFGLRALLRFFAKRPEVAQMAVVDVLAAGPAGVAERDHGLGLMAMLLGDEAMEAADGKALPLWQEVIAAAIQELIYREVSAGRAAQLEDTLPTMLYLTLVARHGPAGAIRRSGLRAEGPTEP